MPVEHLFVYGSLGPGRPNAHVLEGIGGDFVPASVRGHLRAEGWGAGLGFPGLVPDESGPEVHGFVFSSNHWAELDRFEGAEDERLKVTARLENGERVNVWVYVLQSG